MQKRTHFIKLPKTKTLVVGFLVYLLARLFDWWFENKLDDLAKDKTMSDLMTKAADLAGYIAHPYVLVFLFGGIVFSFPEWRSYAVRALRRFIPENRNSEQIRNDIGVSLAWSNESVSSLPDNESSGLWRLHCQENKDGTTVWFPSCGTLNEDSKKLLKGQLVQKLVLTNHSDKPIFRLGIPVDAEIGIRINDRSYQPLIHETFDVYSSEKHSLKPNESVSIYLVNTSDKKYIAVLNLMGYAKGELFESDGPVKIKYTWEGFRPLKIELIGGESE